jgi:hypothetical protein
VKGGVNYNYWQEKFEDFHFLHTVEPEYGFELGFIARQKILKNFYINAELLYTHRNSSIKHKTSGKSLVVMKNDFVVIPIYFSYKFFSVLNLDLGVQYSRIIHCKTTPHSSEYLFPSEIKRLNLVGALIGLRYNVGKNTSVNFNYTYTYNQITKYYFADFAAAFLSYQTVSPRTISLTFGYNF